MVLRIMSGNITGVLTVFLMRMFTVRSSLKIIIIRSLLRICGIMLYYLQCLEVCCSHGYQIGGNIRCNSSGEVYSGFDIDRRYVSDPVGCILCGDP